MRGVLESMVYSYMYNNNNKEEIVWFEFILIYYQFSFILSILIYARLPMMAYTGKLRQKGVPF